MPPTTNLLHLLSAGLKDALKALQQISKNNPLQVNHYQAFYFKDFGAAPADLQLTDDKGLTVKALTDDFLVWLPDNLVLNPKQNYTLTGQAFSRHYSGEDFLKARNRTQRRCYTTPLAGEGRTENVQAAIHNFLKTVVESPTDQQPLSARPEGKGPFRLRYAGFGSLGQFWFVPENEYDGHHREVYLAFNLYEVQKQYEAAENWKHRTPEYARALSPFFEYTSATRNALSIALPTSVAEPNWHILTDLGRAGADQQRHFVQKALATPDVALLEGPPGSGKTTVIMELVLQLIKQGKRVLLSSATHVAIDNVLERLQALKSVDPSTGKPRNELSTEILAVRIASNPQTITAESVRPLHDRQLAQTLRHSLGQHYAAQPHTTAGQQLLLRVLENPEADELACFLLNQANLVAGTLVGLLQHRGLKERQPDFEPFDYLIVDEASKVTLSGFLVPAQWASRWILVGDTQQLAPYSEKAILETILMGKHGLPADVASEVVQKLSDAYDYRQHKTESVKRTEDLERAFQQVTKLNLWDNAVQDHSKTEQLKALAQLFLPSVFELFQRGLPDWLKPENQDFTLHAGLEKMGGASRSESDCRTDARVWEDRFEALQFQHRMVDGLARIPRVHIYNGENMHSDPHAAPPNPLFLELLGANDTSPAVWIPVHANGNNRDGNAEEARKVVEILTQIDHSLKPRLDGHQTRVLVICFYKAQMQRLKKMLETSQFSAIKPDPTTVDSVQGQEADLVLLCFSKWSSGAFYQVPNRLNVALTRARQRLFLFGNPEAIGKNTRHPALHALCTEIPNLTQVIE